LNSAALSIPDGIGLILAGRLLGTPLRQQVTGTDLTYRLCGRAAREGWRVFLLGAAPGVAELAAQRLRALFPGLLVVGTHAGSPLESAEDVVRAHIRSAGPVDLLFVAYGAPAQERWIVRNQRILEIPVAIGIGGVLDFASGRVRRAPVWVRRVGLDWLFRLIRQPRRWRRQLALPRFAWAVLGVAARRRLRRLRPFLGVDSPNLGQDDKN
jgi:N-acetylglucosaminyldiphosphoundecaprenol N-acetyl-beta-D-mannosaminyltransferase